MQLLKLAAITAITLAAPSFAAPAADPALAARTADALATVEHLLTFTRREAVDAMKAAVEKRAGTKPVVLGYKRDAEPGAKPNVLGYRKREAEEETEEAENSGFNVDSILDYCAS